MRLSVDSQVMGSAFAGLWPKKLASITSHYRAAKSRCRTYRNHLEIVGLSDYGFLKVSGFARDERYHLTLASMRLANNQINEACNKFYATVELARTVKDRTYLGQEGISSEHFGGEFILGALIPVLYYSQIASLLSLLSSYGVVFVRDKRSREQRHMDHVLKSQNWGNQFEFFVMRTRHDYVVHSRSEVGNTSRFHQQLFTIAEKFFASGVDVKLFDFNLLRELKKQRELVDYSVLGETTIKEAMGFDTYLKFLPKALNNLRCCIEVINRISGITNNCDIRLSNLEKSILPELFQHPYSIKVDLSKQIFPPDFFTVSFTGGKVSA